MKFIIDAQLPIALCDVIRNLGHEAKHTLDFENKNKTKDPEIVDFAFSTGATVISKDNDFYHSFILYGKPERLVQVKVGNLKLRSLISLFEHNLPAIASLLVDHRLVVLHRDRIVAAV